MARRYNRNPLARATSALVIPMIVVVLLMPAGADARTWTVLVDGTGDAPTIQAAVDSCQDGDEVILGPGSHPGDEVAIRRKSIEIRSVAGAQATDTPSVFATSADDVVIEGVRLRWTGGFAPLHAQILRSFVLRDCIVRDSQGHAYFIQINHLVIEGCEFTRMFDGDAFYGGGALCVAQPIDCEIRDSRFVDNESPVGNPEYLVGGGAIYVSAGHEGPRVSIHHCVFIGNRAPSAGAILGGTPLIQIHHNTFVGNRSNDAAVLVWEAGFSPGFLVSNNIFAYNEQLGLLAFFGGAGRCPCNAYWENLADDNHDGWSGYCDPPGSRQFYVDPRFCSVERNDLGLREDSPLLPGSDTPGLEECGNEIGASQALCDPLPAVKSSWGRIKMFAR